MDRLIRLWAALMTVIVAVGVAAISATVASLDPEWSHRWD